MHDCNGSSGQLLVGKRYVPSQIISAECCDCNRSPVPLPGTRRGPSRRLSRLPAVLTKGGRRYARGISRCQVNARPAPAAGPRASGPVARQAAACLQRQDGRPITPKYLTCSNRIVDDLPSTAPARSSGCSHSIRRSCRRGPSNRGAPVAGSPDAARARTGHRRDGTARRIARLCGLGRMTRPIVASEGVAACQPSTRSHGTRRSQERA
jgi:hypothetical protein